jgi:two-component system nitrate/nitrite response regulator NarL
VDIWRIWASIAGAWIFRLTPMRAHERISVFVADDHPVFREAVGRAIKSRPEFELAGVAGDGHEALAEIRELQPAVALLDNRLPSLAGVDILRAIQRDCVATRVIILSADDSGSLVYEAVQLGAAGFLTKVATLTEICDAVAAVARGATVLAPEIQSGLVGEVRAQSETVSSPLSERESEVLRLIADGLSAPEIGTRLYISSSTVKTHIRKLFEKLGVSDRAAAVAEGMRRGLLE